MRHFLHLSLPEDRHHCPRRHTPPPHTHTTLPLSHHAHLPIHPPTALHLHTSPSAAAPFKDFPTLLKPANWKTLFCPGATGCFCCPRARSPRGTISAVATGYLVYMIIPIYLSLIMKNTDVLRADSMTLIMRHVARWGSWIVLGVWAASLSSAMGALLGAPRTLQAKVFLQTTSKQ